MEYLKNVVVTATVDVEIGEGEGAWPSRFVSLCMRGLLYTELHQVVPLY